MAFGVKTTLGSYRPPRVIGSRRQPGSGSGGLAAAVRATQQPGYLPAYNNRAPWEAPPSVIPSAAYNPALDIELAAGKAGTKNTIEDLIRGDTRGEDNRLLGEHELGEQHDRTLAQLVQNYQRLGQRQGEGANAAGVLNSGALAQAAAKRQANEGKAREPIESGYHNALAKLALTRQREHEDATTGIGRAESAQQAFETGTRQVEAREATNNGYIDPGGVVSRTSQQRGGFVRVGGTPRANPYAGWGRR